jgi:hypothetical protein
LLTVIILVPDDVVRTVDFLTVVFRTVVAGVLVVFIFGRFVTVGFGTLSFSARSLSVVRCRVRINTITTVLLP